MKPEVQGPDRTSTSDPLHSCRSILDIISKILRKLQFFMVRWLLMKRGVGLQLEIEHLVLFQTNQILSLLDSIALLVLQVHMYIQYGIMVKKFFFLIAKLNYTTKFIQFLVQLIISILVVILLLKKLQQVRYGFA